MAVTPIDPPVGELPSSLTPVRFSVDNLVGLIIGVDHSDSEVSRPVEFAYADGVFLYPYLASSFNPVGNVFSILRQGGWASFEERNKVRVFEQEPAPTPEYGLIYAVDFASLANQALVGGSNIIDGRAWWLKGALRADESAAIVNGAGLRAITKQNQPLVHYDTGDQTVGFCLYLDFAQLADYDPTRPVILQWRYEDDTVLSAGSSLYSVALWDLGLNIARPTNAERLTGPCVQSAHPPGPGADNYAQSSACWPGSGQTSWNYIRLTTVGETHNRVVYQLAHTGLWRTSLLEVSEQANATAWPSSLTDSANPLSGYPGTGSVTALVNVPSKGAAPAMPSYGACLWYENGGAGAAESIATLRALRVLQPGVS